MDREGLKEILRVSTKRMPPIDMSDDHIDAFLDILNKTRRWEMLNEYNMLHPSDLEDYLNIREDLFNELRNRFINDKIESKLARINHTYPRWMTEKGSYIPDKTIVIVDLSEACYQVNYYFGNYEEETWNEYVSKFTNNNFIRNNDEVLLYEVMFGKDSQTNFIDRKAFSMAYKELIWRAMCYGLGPYLETHGCVYHHANLDSLSYTVENQELFNEMLNDWPMNSIRTFNGIKVHYDTHTEERKTYCSERENHIEKRVILTKPNNQIFVPSAAYDIRLPQYKKLYMGQEVTEEDLYFYGPEIKADKIQILD